jgi:hypothetical protein
LDKYSPKVKPYNALSAAGYCINFGDIKLAQGRSICMIGFRRHVISPFANVAALSEADAKSLAHYARKRCAERN